MTDCIFIPNDPEHALARTQLIGLDDYQRAVGGLVEVVTITRRLNLLVDEDGKGKQLRVNRRATVIWWLNEPMAHRFDVICGPAVLIGAASRHSFANVPTDVDVLLLERQNYVLEARWQNGGWRPVDSFSSYFEAGEMGLRFRDAVGPEEIRVVAAL